MLVSFVSLTLIYNFFELMGDMVRNSNLPHHADLPLFPHAERNLSIGRPSAYWWAFCFTLGVMSKQNEITAFKACGVSLYRLARP